MLGKFLTKENVLIAIIAFYMVVQSNYFATKLDLANVKLEMTQMKIDLKEYSDNQDKEILKDLDNKYNIIINLLEKKK